MEKVFVGSTVEQCLSAAMKELNISKESLKYKVLEEKKGILKKSAKISVELPTISYENSDDGLVKVVNGGVVVTNPKNDGQPACVFPSKDIRLIVDGEEVKATKEVYEKSNIECILTEEESKRKISITTSLDKMEAFISIVYSPVHIYQIKDKEASRELILESVVKEKIFPSVYNTDEIKQELNNSGVIYGIDKDAIEKCKDENGVFELLIAKGQKVIDEKDEVLEVKFSVDKDLFEDGNGNIDFKSIGSVEAVEKGDILAIKHKTKNGIDGIEVTGVICKFKASNKIKIKIGTGCILKDEDTVVAIVKGKPCIKNNIFYVFPVHEMNEDVDIKSGNIKFPGDIVINGSVFDGMSVEAGNSLKISGNIERANIVSKGTMDIKGNIISSNLIVGGEDILKIKQIKNITSLIEILAGLAENIEQIKRFNLLGYNKTDGQIVKVLIETKYKLLPSICLAIITDIALEKRENSENKILEEENDKIIELIRGKLIGLSPINIKNYGELDMIVYLLNNKKEAINKLLQIPANAKLSYIQDSTISCSGDVVIVGKGSLVSNIKANSKVTFSQANSIIRGGTIFAKDEIRCKSVGSEGGILTKLQVGKSGHIYASIAYENTQFSVGGIEYNLETKSKGIHVFLNNNNELTVDKLKL